MCWDCRYGSVDRSTVCFLANRSPRLIEKCLRLQRALCPPHLALCSPMQSSSPGFWTAHCLQSVTCGWQPRFVGPGKAVIWPMSNVSAEPGASLRVAGTLCGASPARQ